jgi:exonuclease III
MMCKIRLRAALSSGLYTIILAILVLNRVSRCSFLSSDNATPSWSGNRPHSMSLDLTNSFFCIPNSQFSVPVYLYLFQNRVNHPRHSSGKRIMSHGIPLYIFLILLLAGDVEVNPGPPNVTTINFCHLNIASLRSKAPSLSNFLIENNIDIIALNETWLRPTDTESFLADLTPSTFTLINEPRPNRDGGGLAFFHRSGIPLTRTNFDVGKPKSFEALASSLSAGNKCFVFLNIYRPPSLSLREFFLEFQTLLELLISKPSDLIITGDFNIHMDTVDSTSCNFRDLLTAFDLKQHVTVPTHSKGHILDLLLTRNDCQFISSLAVKDPYLSDHLAITTNLLLPFRTPPNYTTTVFRPWHNFDLSQFKSDIRSSQLFSEPAATSSELATQIHETLKSLLDKQIPSRTKKLISRQPKPWFNPDIAEARRRRSNLERTWRRSRLECYHRWFKDQCKVVRKLVSRAKSEYLTNLISENAANPRTLWKVLNSVLHRNSPSKLPTSFSPSDLATTFIEFFGNKIATIRSKFTAGTFLDEFSSPESPPPLFSSFHSVMIEDVRKIVFSCQNKHCLLDAIPTSLLKDCFDILGPFLTRLINLSLSEGCFPHSFTKAIVHPLLKKPSLDPDNLSNYRPISQLNFISKLLERIVAKQIEEHLSSHALFLPFQSAYRKFHSTETALLTVHNDILVAMDKGKVTALVMLDLSAAFDTVDHSILIQRLENWFGISGSALEWFRSYLLSRTQSVCVQGSSSEPHELFCGVPQGSVLGPLLFTLYTTPLGSLFDRHSFNYHLYADDTQLLVSFDQSSLSTCCDSLSNVFGKVQSWMTANKLLLNPSKTEFLLLGTPQQLRKFESLKSLDLSDSTIFRSDSVRNLGVTFNSTFSFDDHVKSICRISQYHIRDIRRIRHLVPSSALICLANALVSSRLDYCNSILVGVSKSNISKLQRVQNSLARAITKTPKFEHITPVLKSLHWLPIEQRITFKVGLLVYKTLHLGQPSYLRLKLTYQNHRYSTRSLDNPTLFVPETRTVLGRRAFSVAGPRLWNSLPPCVRKTDSILSFRKKLKSHLFDIAFPP